MKRNRKIYWVGAILAVFVFTTLAGCSAARRPAPPEQTPGTPPGARQALPTDPREATGLAQKMVREAEKVEGVESATVVLAGSTAYVGINVERGTEDRQTEQIKRTVATRIKNADNRIARVLVTTDPNLITRLEEISQGVAQGRPVDAFTDELRELNQRMTPTTR
ncbi:MAG: YhcN/YlaJ family sporulation lipoprotein [Firmicutes bacterium]|nr:YhcN/YlaJ family sporulation lipoprotein [Bacillota bacterium]MBV1726936.1 YhcN/YlaJ family sporulation lipoprotein [Desulforudis sp.]MBU4533980.1 YhcN/YlaJ family sporulation lipoprotein [Bacillota bacterium]MBU4554249.1 YhcN/YlaJ family sporulation lipoprotein [Bacillota bacterium]MBV1734798.1 YhcN/YlaJ family sporulation lipoprotein [Desulforudis sp.]